MLKRALIIGAFALGLILCGLFLVDAERYAGLITGPLQRSAQQAGVNLSLENSRLTLRSFSSGKVGASFPVSGFPVLLDINDLEIRPQWMRVLMLRPAFDISGKLYSGEVTGEISFDDWGQSGTWRLVLKGVELGSHPQISGLGLSGGILSLTSEGVNFNSAGVSGGQWNFNLENLEMAKTKIIPPALSGSPLDISLPAFSKTTLRVKSAARSPRLTDFDVVFNSSLGEASGKGTFQGPADAQVVAFDLQATLTKAGQDGLGGYLVAASNFRLESTTEKFSLTVSGPLRQPQYTYKKLQ